MGALLSPVTVDECCKQLLEKGTVAFFTNLLKNTMDQSVEGPLEVLCRLVKYSKICFLSHHMAPAYSDQRTFTGSYLTLTQLQPSGLCLVPVAKMSVKHPWNCYCLL